jgi:hypothetical protein
VSRVPGSTAVSSTRAGTRAGRYAEARRATADLGALFRFRLAGLRGRARHAAPIALGVIVGITVLVSVLPAFLPEYDVSRRSMLILLPSGYVSVLVISIVSAATSGGGRELLPREQAVAFPVSPTTDHLGALLMAPLNIAWLLQSWVILGATSYGVGARPTLVLALLPAFLWLAAATALAQALAWLVEWLRRGPRGALVVRALAVALVLVAAAVIVTDRLTWLLDRSPTLRIAMGVLDGAAGRWTPWLRLTGQLLLLVLGAVVAGAWLAGAVARRPARDELRVESAGREARANPASDFAALVRTDRAGIWRSVPMRRGMAVLALFPGIVAVAGSFTWDMLGIFPGLVASGGALLFGVNSWCLDGRGALWRDSLPAAPRLAFASRAVVLLEILLAASALTLVIASLRAGLPTLSQLVAVLCAAVVVTVQVVATALRWSVRRPYSVDLRSSRATPAPPLVMVGYSARLALTTTFVGLLFNLASRAPWQWSLVVAAPFLVWSAGKLYLTAQAWSNPGIRSRVVATVTS